MKTLKNVQGNHAGTVEGLYKLESDAFIMGVSYSEKPVPKEAGTYFLSIFRYHS